MKILKKSKLNWWELLDLLKLSAGNVMIFLLFIAICFVGFLIILMVLGENAYQEISLMETAVVDKIDGYEKKGYLDDKKYFSSNIFVTLMNMFGDTDFDSEIFTINSTDFDSEFFSIDSDSLEMAKSFCFVASGIIDENGNLLYSSEERLYLFFEHVAHSCKISEIPELYESYQKMKSNSKYDTIELIAASAYVDVEHYRFIPYEIELKGYYSTFWGASKVETTSMTLNVTPDENYELITIDDNASDMYFVGTHVADFDALFNSSLELEQPIEYTNIVKQGNSAISKIYTSIVPVWMNGQKNYLFVIFEVEFWNTSIRNKWIIFVFFTFVFYFLFEILPNIFAYLTETANQAAKNEFRNYQQTLINSLAHDIKTPLTRISFNTELLAMHQIGEQPQQYLGNIMENINHIDDIINKTLELSKIQEIHSLDKDDISSLKEFTQQILRYHDHDVEIIIEGDAQIKANSKLFSICIENLINNAVKYVSSGGTITIKIDQKAFQISNDINTKIDTTNLLMPFVKGEVRNDKSSGLGLAIADDVAKANGFHIVLKSDDQQFTASILF